MPFHSIIELALLILMYLILVAVLFEILLAFVIQRSALGTRHPHDENPNRRIFIRERNICVKAA